MKSLIQTIRDQQAEIRQLKERTANLPLRFYDAVGGFSLPLGKRKNAALQLVDDDGTVDWDSVRFYSSLLFPLVFPDPRSLILFFFLELPDGAATVTADYAIDTSFEYSAVLDEFVLIAPAMSKAEMPNKKTMRYDIITSAKADLSSPTVYIKNAIVQTGANDLGCAGATFTFPLPSNPPRYFGLRITGSDVGDASGLFAKLEGWSNST